MFCNNCGTQFDDSQAFCPNCGTASAPAEQAPVQAPAGNNNMKDKLPLIIVAAAIIVLVIVIIVIAASGGYKKSVKNMFKYMEKGNTEKLLKLGYPKEIYEELIDEIYDMDVDEYVEAHDAAFEALWEGLEDEGKVKIDYEIKKAENLDKLDDLEDEVYFGEVEDLDDFIDYMDDVYGDYDFDADKIKKAYAVEVKYTIEVDGDKAIKDTEVIVVYKYKGDWYTDTVYDASTLAASLDSDDYEDVIEDVGKELEDVEFNFDFDYSDYLEDYSDYLDY